MDVIKVVQFSCSNCEAPVKEDDDSCGECGRDFEGEPELEKGLDEDELEELRKNLMMTTCSECGEVAGAEDNVCSGCGRIFLEDDESQCSNCKKAVDSDAEKCPHCGAVFE